MEGFRLLVCEKIWIFTENNDTFYKDNILIIFFTIMFLHA